MGEKGRFDLGLNMIGIAALFLAGFFLLVVFGAQSYRGTVAGRSGNMDDRALLAYLATVAKANDREASLMLRHDDRYGDVLVIADGESGYATRLYHADGALMEDYSRLDAPLSPQSAQRIAETERFEIRSDGRAIAVFTDAGRVLIRQRSEEGRK